MDSNGPGDQGAVSLAGKSAGINILSQFWTPRAEWRTYTSVNNVIIGSVQEYIREFCMKAAILADGEITCCEKQSQ